MNVLLVAPWDKERGGVVTVVEDLASELERRGHRILFLHPSTAVYLKHGKTSAGFEGVQLRLGFPFAAPRRLVSALAFPFLFPVVLAQLLWLVWKSRIEVINVHFPSDRFFYFALCRALLPVRLVTSVHGSDLFDIGKMRRTYSMALRWILRSSDRITLPSNDYRNAFVSRFPALSAKAVCIHNGVDLDRFQSERTRTRREDPYILFVGRIAETKGLDVLLHASSLVLAGYPRLRLVIVGDGPLKPAMESLALQLGIQDKAVFLGSKRSDEVAALLHGCEVFVLPSRAESFGIVILEAMACKRPVIATAIGGIPEIIKNEVNGLLVPADDAAALAGALRRVLSDKSLQETIAANAYTTVRNRFAFDRTASAYERAFLASAGNLVESRTQGFVGHDAQTK